MYYSSSKSTIPGGIFMYIYSYRVTLKISVSMTMTLEYHLLINHIIKTMHSMATDTTCE